MSIKKQYSIGIDIGGTKMAAVLYDGKNVVADYVLGTPKDNLEHFLIMIQALVEPLLEKAKELKVKINGVGLGVAGVINYGERKVLNSPNIPLINNVKIAEMLERKINLSVAMDNDCNCFVRAEALSGAAKQYKNVYGIIVGTGIGGAWWHNNEVYLGAHGGAGEPGEMVVDFEKGYKLERDSFHKVMQNNPAKVAEEAYRGDALAQKAFADFGRHLGLAFANIINIVDPEVIVIGGGVIQAADMFLAEVKKSMLEYIHSPESRKNIKVLKSKLGDNACAIGAALLIHST